MHKLHLEMDTPAKQVILANTKNKIQLNAFLVTSILDTHFCTSATQKHTLTIAGVYDIPIEITTGIKINNSDLRSTHEEADILITQHAIHSACLEKSVRVISDDTDVFVLLVHYHDSMCKEKSNASIIMSSPVQDRAVVDIGATSEIHSDIACSLLAIHGLSGSDTTSLIHGIGHFFKCRKDTNDVTFPSWQHKCINESC